MKPELDEHGDLMRFVIVKIAEIWKDLVSTSFNNTDPIFPEIKGS